MFRAGKKIEFNKDVLISENGILLSPVINLCGLILRADREIPYEIKSFLESKGVEVKRVIYQQESHIELSGYYKLTKTDLTQFVMEHLDLISKQYQGLKKVPSAVNLKKEISKKIDDICELEVFHDEDIDYSRSAAVMKALNIRVRTSERIYNSGKMGAESSVILSSPDISNQGKKLGRVGFFASVTAKADISMQSQVSIHENSMIDAGEVLSIKSDKSDHATVEKLRLDLNIKWLNNLSPEFIKDTETADLLEEADQLLMTIRMGGTV